jgi:putative membrane protein
MRNRTSKLLAAGISAIALASCAHEQQPVAARESAGRISAPRATRTAPPSAAAYVATAAAIDLFEIRSAELAMQRSSARRVRDFASMMIDAHRGTSAQLSLAGRRLNLLPSATLDPKHQAMLDQLQGASNFDALYRSQQLSVHREALALHSNYARAGASPTLRPVAQAIVPIVQRHLRLLALL